MIRFMLFLFLAGLVALGVLLYERDHGDGMVAPADTVEVADAADADDDDAASGATLVTDDEIAVPVASDDVAARIQIHRRAFELMVYSDIELSDMTIVDLYEDTDQIEDADTSYIVNYLMRHGFTDYEWTGRGNWPGGPRIVAWEIWRGESERYVVKKKYCTIEGSDKYRVVESIEPVEEE